MTINKKNKREGSITGTDFNFKSEYNFDIAIGAVSGATDDGIKGSVGIEQTVQSGFTGVGDLEFTVKAGNEDPNSQSTWASIMDTEATNGTLESGGVSFSSTLPNGLNVTVGQDTKTTVEYMGAADYNNFTKFLGKDANDASASGLTIGTSYGFGNGVTVSFGYTLGNDDTIGIGANFNPDDQPFTVSAYYQNTGDTDNISVQGAYSADDFTVSGGYGMTMVSNSDDTSGYWIGAVIDSKLLGLSQDGTISVGVATTGEYAENEDPNYIYELSATTALIDGMTVTPGLFYKETGAGNKNMSGYGSKVGFSF